MPLHPQIHDFLERIHRVADNVSSDQIIIEHLRHYLAIKATAQGNPSIMYQLLIYPAVTTNMKFEFPSMSENADGYLLTRESILWF
jgi:hypothetical protein